MTVVVCRRICRITSVLRLAVHLCGSPILPLLGHYMWSDSGGGHYMGRIAPLFCMVPSGGFPAFWPLPTFLLVTEFPGSAFLLVVIASQARRFLI
jgi:hypothetical protein